MFWYMAINVWQEIDVSLFQGRIVKISTSERGGSRFVPNFCTDLLTYTASHSERRCLTQPAVVSCSPRVRREPYSGHICFLLAGTISKLRNVLHCEHKHNVYCSLVYRVGKYRGADKSLARPGRKQANVSVRMA